MRWWQYDYLDLVTQHLATHNMRRYVDETWSESGGRGCVWGGGGPQLIYLKTYGIWRSAPHQLAVTGIGHVCKTINKLSLPQNLQFCIFCLDNAPACVGRALLLHGSILPKRNPICISNYLI